MITEINKLFFFLFWSGGFVGCLSCSLLILPMTQGSSMGNRREQLGVCPRKECGGGVQGGGVCCNYRP